MSSIVWNQFNFEGVKKRVQIGRAEMDVQHTKFFGVPGTSAIDGEVASTPLSCEIWLNKETFVTAKAVSDYLALAQTYVGFSDDLVDIAKNFTRTFPDCEFHGFEQHSDILPALGVGLIDDTFWVHVEFFWLQLGTGWI